MTPERYDNWYKSSRGSWIGNTEFNLIKDTVSLAEGDSLLDVGCGTGYFTRRFAPLLNGNVVGVDRNLESVNFANRHSIGTDSYVTADAEHLPFSDKSFDHAIAVTSLCFTSDEELFVSELFRVARKSVTVGLLNRCSLLWLWKRRSSRTSGYYGAHWHTPGQARSLFRCQHVRDLQLSSAIFYPFGREIGSVVEGLIPSTTLIGGFLLVSGTINR